MDAANAPITPMPTAPGALDERDQAILAFERQWWKYAGAKEQAIRELFDMSATRYYQVLNALIDRPEALTYDPMLVKRLRRLRATRQRARSARRLGISAKAREVRGVDRVVIRDGAQHYTLSHTLLEGHRFAVRPIAAGEALLSWELPFGSATRAILPGEYVCNAGMLEALGGRSIDFALPAAPNFEDHIEPYMLDASAFVPAEPTMRYPEERTFMGYRRPGGRGVGTRNFIVLLGTSSRTGFTTCVAAMPPAATSGKSGWNTK